MDKLDKGIYRLVKNFVGPSETNETAHLCRKSRIMICYGFITDIVDKTVNLCNNLSLPRYFVDLLKILESKMERILNAMNNSDKCKHSACNHRYNCFIYAGLGFGQRFIVGFLMQAAIKLLTSLRIIIKNPKFIFKILKNPVNRQLGMFLGLYVFIFRVKISLQILSKFWHFVKFSFKNFQAVSCLYRWITNKDHKINGLIAGFFAGWSMMFYKSSSIAMYLSIKLVEVIWMLGVANKTLPLYKSFDAILYSLSTAFVLWVVSFMI